MQSSSLLRIHCDAPCFSAHLKRRDPPVDAASQSALRKVPLHLPQGRIGETARSLDVSRETSVRSSSVKREGGSPPSRSTRLAKTQNCASPCPRVGKASQERCFCGSVPLPLPLPARKRGATSIEESRDIAPSGFSHQTIFLSYGQFTGLQKDFDKARSARRTRCQRIAVVP